MEQNSPVIAFENSTCRYATERIATLERQGSLRPKSRFHRWKAVTRVEMKAFIAAILNMGIIQVK